MTAMSLPLATSAPPFDLARWRSHAGAAGVALALHVALAAALLGHDYRPSLPTPVVPVITTQLVSVPAPPVAPVVEPPVPVEATAPVIEPPAPVEPVKAPAPVVPSAAELAFKREQQARVAEQKRQRDEARQRQEQAQQERLRQEQLAREADAAREARERQVAERRAADERARAAAASQQYLPIAKKAPDYPQRALDKGVQGDCTVSYTVDIQGRVRDPQVLDGCHPWFAQPSLQAARSFRYQPKLVEGRAVEVPGVKNTFHFSIEQGSR